MFEAERASLVRLCRPLRRVPCGAGVGVEDLPGPLRQQPLLGVGAVRSGGRWRSAPMPIGSNCARTAARRRACPQLRARPDGLRPLALRAGAGPQARRAAQRRAVQGLGAAGALERVRRKLAGSADGDRQMVDDPDRGARATGCRRSRRPARRRCARASTRRTSIINILARRREPAAAGHHHDAGRAAAAACADRRLRPLRQPQESPRWNDPRS